jgi:Abnormal spindle-like microcephaly-assoc'd, ASPM-SPD-2-Hydin
LFYRDRNQDGTGDVADPRVIGLGGWRDFLFLFSAGNGIIYAVDPALVGPDRYEIDGRVELRPGAQIAFSRTSLDFGLLGIGESAVHTLRISNSGLAPLVVTVPAAPSLSFSSVALQATLLPDDGVDLRIEFSPIASGTAEDSLMVTSNAPGSPHRILLTGSGRDEIPN